MGPTPQAHRSKPPLGLYIHIPFCVQKCPYCDFNTYAKLEHLYQAFVDALCQELAHWSHVLARPRITTIFLGGGTPTALSAGQLAQIFDAVFRAFQVASDCEITSEANPGTVDQEKFVALHELGVNRLSMGVQSFQPDELAFLGRIHSVRDVYTAYETARQAGFENINLDFMFGLPGQSRENWEATLEEALALAPEHLSLYSLIVEPNTPLYHWVQTGRVPHPDEDEAGALYEWAMERLAQQGYVQYEVSNWARADVETASVPRLACRHNLIYWRNEEYVGVGPGAHSHMRPPVADPIARPPAETAAIRWSNHRPVPGYIRRVKETGFAVAEQENLDMSTSMGETMMMGLRLLQEGVPFARFRAQYNRDLRAVYGSEIERLAALGLLRVDQERVRLTRRGLMVANQVVATFLP